MKENPMEEHFPDLDLDDFKAKLKEALTAEQAFFRGTMEESGRILEAAKRSLDSLAGEALLHVLEVPPPKT